MTEIEVKALALVNAHAINRRSDLDDAKHTELRCALLDAVQSQAATEARHAAEMRELKERFSEAALLVDDNLEAQGFAKTNQMRSRLAPFIIPAPDPLVELAREMTLLDGVVRTDSQKAAIREGRAGNTASDDFYDRLRTALASRQYEVRKIGEAGE